MVVGSIKRGPADDNKSATLVVEVLGRVLRGMRPDKECYPRTGPTPKTLGARPAGPTGEEGDIPVSSDGMVRPETGGMSVSPPPVKNVIYFRRPPEHGGTAKKLKLYEMETDELPDELMARPDPRNPEKHVFIEPAYEMSFEEYQGALESTRDLWRLV